MRLRAAFTAYVALAAVACGCVTGYPGASTTRAVFLARGGTTAAWESWGAPILEELLKLTGTAAMVVFVGLLARRTGMRFWPPVLGALVGVGFSIAETVLTRDPSTWLARFIFPLAGHASYAAIAALVAVSGIPISLRAGSPLIAVALHMLNNNILPFVALVFDVILACSTFLLLRAAHSRWARSAGDAAPRKLFHR